ncbi:MAG: hypothetical protein AAFX55_01890 [Bacteroidota bacterium]
MLIFYGDRTEKGDLNWKPTEIELKNKEQFVIFCKDTLILNEIRTRAFGGVETYQSFLKIDTLGFLSSREVVSKFPEIENNQTQKDTLIVYQELEEFGEVYVYKTSIIKKDSVVKLMRKNYNDSILTIYDSKRINDNYSKQMAFYESINISKLGWINIDQYSKIEDKVKVNIETNLNFNFNIYTDEAYKEDSAWHQTYLVDMKSNTILNVYSSSIDIPREKAFTLVSFCIVDNTFYVCRKAIKFSEDHNDLLLEYKKRNENQIKSLLKL